MSEENYNPQVKGARPLFLLIYLEKWKKENPPETSQAAL